MCWAALRQLATDEDKEVGWNDDDVIVESKWHIPSSCYKGCGKWRGDLSLALTKAESEYLGRQIAGRFPGSLYAQILSDAKIRQLAIDATTLTNPNDSNSIEELNGADAFYNFCLTTESSLPDDLADLCRRARLFSDFVYALASGTTRS